MENNTTSPESPGGTTVEEGIETVTVTASKLPDWKKIAMIVAFAAILYRILNS